jgi:hypothetical protein
MFIQAVNNGLQSNLQAEIGHETVPFEMLNQIVNQSESETEQWQ